MYTTGCLSKDLQILHNWSKKAIHGNCFHEMTLVACTITLYNTHELAWATHKDTMADKLAEERFSIDSAVREFCIYKELRDCLVSHSFTARLIYMLRTTHRSR